MRESEAAAAVTSLASQCESAAASTEHVSLTHTPAAKVIYEKTGAGKKTCFLISKLQLPHLSQFGTVPSRSRSNCVKFTFTRTNIVVLSEFFGFRANDISN